MVSRVAFHDRDAGGLVLFFFLVAPRLELVELRPQQDAAVASVLFEGKPSGSNRVSSFHSRKV